MTASGQRRALLAAIFVLLPSAGCSSRLRTVADVRAALSRGTQLIELPAGQLHLDRPLVVPEGAKNVVVRANEAGSTLVLDPGFQGTAAIVADNATNLTLAGFHITGNRTELKSDWYLPLREAAFADYYTANGIVIRNSTNVTLRALQFSRIRAFPVIVNATAKAILDGLTIEDSGTLNPEGHNNTTGGILLEEGSTGFVVRSSNIRRVTGNAIWTHSYARSPRQADGVIRDNVITGVARDAIQIGHATRVRVENNRGSEIGFPVEYIDFAGYGTPVAIDTAGNVDQSAYTGNEFKTVNGQCLDLDGFHDGQVTGNTCENVPATASQWLGLHFGILFGNHDPGMTSSNITITNNTLRGFAYGGVFLIGDHNRIENNHFFDITLAHCGTLPVTAKCNALLDQPDALRSGIYLSDDGGRPATTRDNTIRNNVIEGFGVARHCITAKQGVDLKANSISGNSCQDPQFTP